MADQNGDDGRRRRHRERALTPLHTPDEALLLVAPSESSRLACIEITVQEGLRPIIATQATMTQIAASSRPLVMVIESDPNLDQTELMDLAVSIGAQLVVVSSREPAAQLSERVRLAVIAARHHRGRG